MATKFKNEIFQKLMEVLESTNEDDVNYGIGIIENQIVFDKDKEDIPIFINEIFESVNVNENTFNRIMEIFDNTLNYEQFSEGTKLVLSDE